VDCGPLGLSPLHISALLEDDGAITLVRGGCAVLRVWCGVRVVRGPAEAVGACVASSRQGWAAAAYRPTTKPRPPLQALLDELELQAAAQHLPDAAPADASAAAAAASATCAVACCSTASCAGAAPRRGPCPLTEATTHDGVTPFHLAFQMGHWTLDRVLRCMVSRVSRVVEQPAGSAWTKLRAAAAEAGMNLLLKEKAARGGGAAAARGAGKVRRSKDLDACLNCQSTAPPLLLSIQARCEGCGVRRPCIGSAAGADAGEGAAASSSAAAAGGGEVGGGAVEVAREGASSSRRQGRRGGVQAPRPPPVPAPARRAVQAAAGLGAAEPCVHVSRVLSVTAMCQSCHANRIMEVA
jgi:hypothetical protein